MEGVELRPVTPDDLVALGAMTEQPSIRRWGWTGVDDEDATRFAIVVDGELAGMVQYGEERDPDHRHAWIDVFVDSAHQGRGIGTEAVRRTVDLLVSERGHHRIEIDPAVDNAVAIRCYEKVGFRPVGVCHSSWRDPDGNWRDALLMELVRRPPGPSPAGDYSS